MTDTDLPELAPLKEAARTFGSVVPHARRGELGEASSRLNAALVALQGPLTSGAMPESAVRDLGTSLETLLAMQEQQDWVALADVLEFELVPMLESHHA